MPQLAGARHAHVGGIREHSSADPVPEPGSLQGAAFPSRHVSPRSFKLNHMQSRAGVCCQRSEKPFGTGAVGWARFVGAWLFLLLALVSCKREAPSKATTARPEAAKASSEPSARAPISVVLAYGSEKKSWLVDAIGRFNDSGARLRAERRCASKVKPLAAALRWKI